MNLAVIFGGQSGEHEISLASAISVIKALDKNKYNIIPIAITKKGNWLIGDRGDEYIKLHSVSAGKENAISEKESQNLVTIDKKNLTNYSEGSVADGKIDLVLPLLHGPFGEDGRIQGMLDMIGIPYVFSGVLAHALAMNKPKTKILVKAGGLLVAEDALVRKNEKYDLGKIIARLSLPIVVKPSELGSSVGVSIAKTKSELEQGIETAFKHDKEVLLERFIKGRELTVPIMGNNPPRALPVIEIIPKISSWFDYKAKYEVGGSEEICPAKIPQKIKDKIQKQALIAYQIIGCRGLARVDVIWKEGSDDLYFLEINTIPGMTATSLVPKSARAAGLSFSQFLDKLIDQALQ